MRIPVATAVVVANRMEVVRTNFDGMKKEIIPNNRGNNINSTALCLKGTTPKA